MKPKLFMGAVVAQTAALLGALVYLGVTVLSGPVVPPKPKPADDELEALVPPAEDGAHAGSESHADSKHQASEPEKAPEKSEKSEKPEKPEKPEKALAKAASEAKDEPQEKGHPSSSHAAAPHGKAEVAAHGEPPAAKATEAKGSGEVKKAEPGPEAQAGPAEVVSALSEGNERYSQGVTRQRDLVLSRQHPARPQAVVVACSDSTAPPELVFDQPLGSLVVVRAPAELVDEGTVAAVEDAVTRLQVPVVLVLGHRGCHAVDAACRRSPGSPGERLVAARLAPVVTLLGKRFSAQEAAAHAVEASVSFAAGQLMKRSAVLKRSQVAVLRVVYDEESGKTAWLDAATQEPAAPERAGRAAH